MYRILVRRFFVPLSWGLAIWFDRSNSPKNIAGLLYLIAGLIGIFGGVASGLFGVGGGVVMVPAMVFFLKMDIKLAVGTSLAVIIPTALSGTYKHMTMGNVDWKVALSLAPTAICGSYIGAWLTTHISSGNLKRAFGGFIILAGLKLLLGK